MSDERGTMNEQPPKRRLPFIVQHPSFIVLTLTLLAATLRFSFLERPSIWGDEAATFMRVGGSFRQLVEELADSAFSPLHYLLYWTIAQFATLTPFFMRLVPGICGTLMVPAMYWLASELVPRKTALLAAAFTACSAYLLNYSRDAKMYMELWLFVTLSCASFLCWLRSRRRHAWYLWVIFSVAVIGLHPPGAIVLAIQLVIFLTHQRLHWKPAILLVVGFALIAAAPAWYYLKLNRLPQRVEDRGLRAAGIQWVEHYNAGRGGPDLVHYTATAFLYNWEWPLPARQSQIRPRTLTLLKSAGFVLFALLMLGVLPWRRRSSDLAAAPAMGGWWRSMLWITAWLVLPAYGFYCASVRKPLPPWTWFTALRDWTSVQPWLAGGFGAALLLCALLAGTGWKDRITCWFWTILVAVIVLGLCVAVYYCVKPQEGSVWMPRYLGAVWPAFGIAVAVLLTRLPTRPLRWGAIGSLILVNLIQFSSRVFAGTEPPTGLIVRDQLDSHPPDATTRTYYRMTRGPSPGTGGGLLHSYPARYYLLTLRRQTVPPEAFRRGQAEFGIRLWNLFMPPDLFIPRDLEQSPQLRRIVVWDTLRPNQLDLNDKLLERLRPEWQRVSEELYPARDHWTWTDLYTCRRRVYQKK